MQIVVIDDDPAICEMLRITLASGGFHDVAFAADGLSGFNLVVAGCPDLVLLDITMPGIDGYEVCRRIRATESVKHVPIIMVTARSTDDDIVVGLDLGANDYVTKPFSRAVLLAHIRAILRSKAMAAEKTLRCDGFTLDSEKRRAVLNGQSISLSPNEFRFLELAMAHPDRIYSRANILDAIQSEVKDVTDRAVDVMMVHLRHKLGTWACHIETVRGIGYRFVY